MAIERSAADIDVRHSDDERVSIRIKQGWMDTSIELDAKDAMRLSRAITSNAILAILHREESNE